MHKIIACLLALASAAAFADGVPLITPGPAIVPSHPVNKIWSGQGHPEFVKLYPIVLNKGAFGANVLTVVIDGEQHRFAGALVPQPSLAQLTKKGMAPPVQQQVWSGSEPGGANIVLSKIGTEVLGTIFLPPGRRFEIANPPGLGSAVLVEIKPELAPRPDRIPEAPSAPASSGSH